MLSKNSARLVAGLTCLMMIAVPVSAQLGAPGVPAVPGVPAAPVPGVPGVPAGVPAVPGVPGAPALPGSPVDAVTVDQRGNAVSVCADATDAHGQATGAAALAQAQADAARGQVEDAARDALGELPEAPLAGPDVPDVSELGLEHCAHANADDPAGTAMGAAGQAQGFLGTLQSWAQKATSWLPF